MKVPFWADRHARSILFLLAALFVAGIFAVVSLPASLFPHVNFPRLRIDLDVGERPPERMAIEVTRPVEETLRGIPGVRGVQSTSSRGSAEIWLDFPWGQDMASALLQAESQINKILPSLPAGTAFQVRRMDPTLFSTISYSLTSNTKSLSELHDLAQYELRPLLSTVPGVARIDVSGGAIEEYRVTVDPAKLAAHDLAVNDVANALPAANVLTAVGWIQDHYKLYLVVTDTRFKNIAEIGKTILHSGADGVVRLTDVADITRAPAPQYTIATADGRKAVLFDVYQQPGANTVEIANQIRQALAKEQARLPAGIKITKWYDQSDVITAAAHSVRDAILIGVGLAILVLLLFLRNWRITLIAAIAVPVVLSITALLLYLVGQSFNIMTLGGMAAAVGLIIDDAIVMSEQIIRRLHHPPPGSPESPDLPENQQPVATRDRVLNATDEFTKPLMGSSLSTIIIYIPPAFMIGVTGAFFAALSLSMASSLVISFFVAWLAIPILAAKFLRAHKRARVGADMGPRHLARIYPRLMKHVLGSPWLVMVVAIPLLVLGYLAYQDLPSGFMPSMDEGGFIIDYIAPPGTSLTETNRLLGKVEDILRRTPEVQTYSRRTGYSMGGDFTEPNSGDFFVRLKPLPRRPIEEVMNDVEKQINQNVPGLDVELAQLMEDVIGDITGRPEPVVINLFSEDEAVLSRTSQKVVDAIGRISGVHDVRNGMTPAGDALDIDVDRVKASLEGVDPQSITQEVANLITGDVTTQIQQGEKMVDVRVWIPKSLRQTTLDIENLQLRAPDGHLFPLKRIARLKIITGQPEITRRDLKRMVSVTARSDRDLGSTIRDVRKVLDRPGLLPQGMRYTLGGLYEQQQIAFRGLMEVIIAGATLVFLLLLFLYESFRVAVAISLTTLLAITAVFLGLWITGTELNVSSLMGIVMIVGIVTEVSIFYYTEFVDFTHLGDDVHKRLIAAGIYRARAITMTTVAAILALLPLALGIGQGSAMLQPLAIAIIAGLIAQLPLVLFLLPGLLSLFRIRASFTSL